jgi:hypothetical protein
MLGFMDISDITERLSAFQIRLSAMPLPQMMLKQEALSVNA